MNNYLQWPRWLLIACCICLPGGTVDVGAGGIGGAKFDDPNVEHYAPDFSRNDRPNHQTGVAGSD